MLCSMRASVKCSNELSLSGKQLETPCLFLWRSRSQLNQVTYRQSRKHNKRGLCSLAATAAQTRQQAAPVTAATMPAPSNSTLLCTSITAKTMAGALTGIEEAHDAGATAVELRIDFLQDFGGEADLKRLLGASRLPVVVTCRPTWEG